MHFLHYFLFSLFLIYMVGRHSNKTQKIKYDCRDRKIFLTLAVIFTILSVCLIALSSLPIMDIAPINLSDYMALGGFIFFPAVALITWTAFIVSTLYLKRLKAYGYELPANKRTFSSRLDKLSKTECNPTTPTRLSKESIALAIISICIFIAIGINSFVFYFKYYAKSLPDLGLLGVYGSIPLLLFWLVISLIFWRQRLCDKYKDNVELDETRKTRKQIEEGIIEILIYLVITIIWITMLYNGVEYIYKSRLATGYYQ